MQLHVVIPSFNAPTDRLSRAVRSALNIDHVARVWVIDDGSAEPVRRADLPEDGRLMVVRQDNAGPSSARNHGLELAADADAVVFLDDDDELLADGVQALLELGDQLGASGLVGARVEVQEGAEGDALAAAEPTPTFRAVPTEWAEQALPSPSDVFAPLVIFSGSGLLVTTIARVTRSGASDHAIHDDGYHRVNTVTGWSPHGC